MLAHVNLETGDLEPEPIDGKNRLQIFELKLPFSFTRIGAFNEKVRQARELAGEQDEEFITMDSLRKKFTSKAWEPLHNDSSIVC